MSNSQIKLKFADLCMNTLFGGANVLASHVLDN